MTDDQLDSTANDPTDDELAAAREQRDADRLASEQAADAVPVGGVLVRETDADGKLTTTTTFDAVQRALFTAVELMVEERLADTVEAVNVVVRQLATIDAVNDVSARIMAEVERLHSSRAVVPVQSSEPTGALDALRARVDAQEARVDVTALATALLARDDRTAPAVRTVREVERDADGQITRITDSPAPEPPAYEDYDDGEPDALAVALGNLDGAA